MNKMLMVLTSHDQLGNTGAKADFWLEEFAVPYYAFKDAGAAVTLASTLGGQPPLGSKIDDAGSQTEPTLRFKAAAAAQAVLASTRRLEDVATADFNAGFYPGGKPVAAVCHAPAGKTIELGRQGVGALFAVYGLGVKGIAEPRFAG